MWSPGIFSNLEDHAIKLQEQVNGFQEQVHRFEAWKATVQEDLKQLKSRLLQQPQEVISKPSQSNAISPREVLLLTRQEHLEQKFAISARSSDEQATAIAEVLERAKKFESFEKMFYAQVEEHRELKDQVTYLEKAETSVLLQQQIDAQLISLREMQSQIKKIEADKIPPFVETASVQIASDHEDGKPEEVEHQKEEQQEEEDVSVRTQEEEEKEEEEAKEEEYEREIDESVWDAMIFVFADRLGVVNSAVMILAFIITCCIQWIFILSVQTSSFTGTSLPSLSDIEYWRYTVAHDHTHMNPMRRNSMTSMVFQQDGSMIVATSQADLLGSIQSYLEPLPIIQDIMGESGHLLCMMSICVWSLVIVQELFGCFQLLLAVCNITSKYTETEIYKDDKKPELYVLHSMSVIRKLSVIIMVCVRICLACLLWRSGNLWLAYDVSVSTLLLNCTALGLVLDIGDLTYAVLMPHHSKVCLGRFKALVLPSHGGILPGISPPLVALILILAEMTFINFHIIKDQTQMMRDLEAIMCAGGQNFVYYIEPVSNTYVTTPSQPFGSAPIHMSHHYKDLTHALIRASDASSVVGVMAEAEWSAFSQAANLGFSGMVRSGVCVDFQRLHEVNRQSLTIRAVYDLTVTSCSDLSKYCHLPSQGNLARLTCPETCGCNDVFSGLVPRTMDYGCPMQSCMIQAIYRDALANAPCVDRTLTELNTMAGWATYFTQLPHFSKKMEFANVRNSAKLVRDGGCSKIYEIRNTSFNDGRVPGSSMMDTLCTGTLEVSGIAAYCPVACGCKGHTEGCPLTCPH